MRFSSHSCGISIARARADVLKAFTCNSASLLDFGELPAVREWVMLCSLRKSWKAVVSRQDSLSERMNAGMEMSARIMSRSILMTSSAVRDFAA